jgi:ubiquinone/menaquinone biosynthesis C-methylase UbiE
MHSKARRPPHHASGGGMSSTRVLVIGVVVVFGLFVTVASVQGSKQAHHVPPHYPQGHATVNPDAILEPNYLDHNVETLRPKHARDVKAPNIKSRHTAAPPVAFEGAGRVMDPKDDGVQEADVGLNRHKAGKPLTRGELRALRQKAQMAANGAFRGVTCPPYDTDIDALQIPLKHLPRKRKTSVAEKYDRRANNCASNGIWNRVRIEDHHKILHHMVRLGRVKRGSFVLDWGSGCGHSLQFLSMEYDVHGVGIDVSNKTIAYARENTTKANLHCVADGSKLQWFPSNTFDHVISFGSIYHVYNRTMFCHVLRQLVRIVKVGGTIYNGWTENGEYHRQHVARCFEDLPVKATVYEESVEYKDVDLFPLKAEQVKPNTYSLVLEKTGPMSNELDEKVDDLAQIPIECGVHKCEERGSGVSLIDTPRPSKLARKPVLPPTLPPTEAETPAPPTELDLTPVPETEAPTETPATEEAETELTTSASPKKHKKDKHGGKQRRAETTAAAGEDAESEAQTEEPVTKAKKHKKKPTHVPTTPAEEPAGEDET